MDAQILLELTRHRPRVFLASRFEEPGIQQLRQALVARFASVESRFALVNLDDGQADHESVVGRSLREVDSCDVVVLLLGSTYRSTEAAAGTNAEGADGPSVTHLEYQRALKTGKPVWAWRTTDPANCEHDRQRHFLGEVMAQHVVPLLDVSTQNFDDAVLAVFEGVHRNGEAANFIDREVDSDASSGFTKQQRIDLGIHELQSYLLPHNEAPSRPRLAEHLETRAAAFRHLARGSAAVALRHFREASALVDDDWLTEFMIARLSNDPGRRPDHNDLVHARLALSLALDSRANTLTLIGEKEFDERRAGKRVFRSALLLTGYLRRYSGPEEALQVLKVAIESGGFDLELMQESLFLSVMLRDTGNTGLDSPATIMLRLAYAYPYAAINLLRDPSVASERAQLEKALLQRMRSIAEHLDQPLQPSIRSVSKALQQLRATAEAVSVATWNEMKEIIDISISRQESGYDHDPEFEMLQPLRERADELSRLIPLRRDQERLHQEIADLVADHLQWTVKDSRLPSEDQMLHWIRAKSSELALLQGAHRTTPPLIGAGRWENEERTILSLQADLVQFRQALEVLRTVGSFVPRLQELQEQLALMPLSAAFADADAVRAAIFDTQRQCRAIAQREEVLRLAHEASSAAAMAIERERVAARLFDEWRLWNSRLAGNAPMIVAAYRPLDSTIPDCVVRVLSSTLLPGVERMPENSLVHRLAASTKTAGAKHSDEAEPAAQGKHFSVLAAVAKVANLGSEAVQQARQWEAEYLSDLQAAAASSGRQHAGVAAAPPADPLLQDDPATMLSPLPWSPPIAAAGPLGPNAELPER